MRDGCPAGDLQIESNCGATTRHETAEQVIVYVQSSNMHNLIEELVHTHSRLVRQLGCLIELASAGDILSEDITKLTAELCESGVGLADAVAANTESTPPEVVK